MQKNPKLEAFKEVARWVVLYFGSVVVLWVFQETLKQITKVPTYYLLKVWVFEYQIPVQQLFVLGLTLGARYADKYIHENGKLKKSNKGKSVGILPF